MRVTKGILAFSLLALMLLKVSSLHVYTHHVDDTEVEDCALCDHALANQSAEFASPSITGICSPVFTVYPSKVKESTQLISITPGIKLLIQAQAHFTC